MKNVLVASEVSERRRVRVLHKLFRGVINANGMRPRYKRGRVRDVSILNF
jgi:hypothetical protein